MTPRIHQTGRDWHTPTAPMTGARRSEVFGPVEPMEQEAGRLGWASYTGLALIGMMIGLCILA